MNKKILLLEDDTLLAQTMDELLKSENYEVRLVRSVDDAVELTYENKFDLYIFDINVPDISGLDVLKSLRDADDKTPTIFISALLDLDSISKAFEIGAEDYIKKPFFPEELLIRINAKLTKKTSPIIYKDLEYNPNTNIIKKDGHEISLGQVQEKLLSLFIKNIGDVLDQETLMDCLEKSSQAELRVALTKLKQTTGLEIKNLRGIGYILEQS